MRLIDADSLLKYLFVTESRTGGSVYAQAYEQGWDDALKAVMENAPTVADLVNVVDVVRCKDCKHRPAFRNDEDGDRYVEGPRYPETLKNGHTFMFEDETCPCVNGWDSYFSYVPKDDWFCANGERRESGGSD